MYVLIRYLIIMKRTYLTIISLIYVGLSYSQEKDSSNILRVESNGIKVYKPVDVEQTLGIKPEAISTITEEKAVSIRTLDDLSTEELEERLYYINLKLEKSDSEGNADDVIRYKKEKQLTENRIQSNKQTTK